MSTRSLPVLGTDAGRVVGGIGVLACVLCCVSVPSIVAAISALGLGFLRNDKLLLPGEVASLGLLLWTFARSRQRHGRWAPTLLALAAAGIMLWGLRSSGPFTTMAAGGGAVAVVALVIWDWRLQKRCAA